MYRRVGADFEKPKKLFSAHNEQGSIKRGEKWSPEKLLKMLTYLWAVYRPAIGRI